MIKFIIEEKEIKAKLTSLNIDEIKNKLDDDNRGPY